MEKIRRFLPHFALLLVGAIWGSSNVIIKDAVSQVPSAFLIALRCTLSSAVLAAIFHKKLKSIGKAEMLGGAIIGLCLFLAYYLQTCSLYFSDPGKCGFLASIYCVIVPFLGWAITRQPPAFRNIAAAVLCLVGVVLCSVNGAFRIAWGDIMALISGIFYAAHIITIGKFGEGKDPVVMTVLQFAFAGLYAWGVAMLTESDRMAVPVSAIVDILYLALVCTGVAMLLQNIGQKQVPANTASILMSTEGVLISVLAGYETVNIRLLLGFALIFAAILFSELKPKEDTTVHE